MDNSGDCNTISLPIEALGRSSLSIGFGWDLPFQPAIFDLDVGVFARKSDGLAVSDGISINFGQESACDGALVLDIGGYLADDDVCLWIDLNHIPSEIQSFDIVLKIFEAEHRDQHFGMIKNAYMRIANKPFNWNSLEHEIYTDGVTASSLGVGKLNRVGAGWSLIKEMRQISF